ncbi:uncharacterized protein LOC124820450 isoform X3 [Vigna umbellata]|uniref:uncharacterized protein LOC124820450 isoform X3 n=1 Tax=Vigna umbellata TaxID=87088 RepID=UPI001F5E5D9F|nr:uncharacterized protein LOC124820450 isoform X3 [Vigna umbellata]
MNTGTHHYWLNRSEKIDQLFGADGIFLVLAASNFNCDITLKKLKTIQKRFPHINIIGLGAIHSSSDQVHLMQLLMEENIAFPILLSQQTFPKEVVNVSPNTSEKWHPTSSLQIGGRFFFQHHLHPTH